MAQILDCFATNCTQILSISVSDSHTSPTSTASITCINTGLDIGDFVTVRLGFQGSLTKVFEGYVKNITRSAQEDKYEITCANAMIRAVDFFIAATNPDEPYSKTNIKAENLVQDLMEMAGLTDYVATNTSFTFATQGQPIEVNLTSVYDYSKFIADILAYHIYADVNGQVHFIRRMPFVDTGDSSSATYGNSQIISASHSRSDRDLRNRVVVYGAEGIYAEAKASSPYLPNGFYKSVAVSAPSVIDTQQMAEDAAQYNLEKLNRLTVGGSITILGDPTIKARDCVTVNKSDMGMTGLFYVYGCEHTWGKEGYTTTLDLRV